MTGRRYNPVIERCLALSIQHKEWMEIAGYMDRLSNADFRTACNILCERLLPTMESGAFWEMFSVLVPLNPKAYLVTFLKGASVIYKEQRLSFDNEYLREYGKGIVENGSQIDRDKFIVFMLPLFEQPNEIELVFSIFRIDIPSDKLAFLIRYNSIACYYVLFRTLRLLEHDHAILENYCILLKKKGDRLSFNLASIIKCYFDLTSVKGTFSLQVCPYELNYLELSYGTFKQVLTRI